MPVHTTFSMRVKVIYHKSSDSLSSEQWNEILSIARSWPIFRLTNLGSYSFIV